MVCFNWPLRQIDAQYPQLSANIFSLMPPCFGMILDEGGGSAMVIMLREESGVVAISLC